MGKRERNQGLAFAAAGLCVIVAAVLLFGLTTATGAIDVVSVITAVVGGMMVATGLYQVFNHRRPPLTWYDNRPPLGRGTDRRARHLTDRRGGWPGDGDEATRREQ